MLDILNERCEVEGVVTMVKVGSELDPYALFECCVTTPFTLCKE